MTAQDTHPSPTDDDEIGLGYGLDDLDSDLDDLDDLTDLDDEDDLPFLNTRRRARLSEGAIVPKLMRARAWR